MAKQYSPATNAVVDADGIPAAIVAVEKGEPLVLLVSEETMKQFNSVKEKSGFTHIELANRIRDAIFSHSGQFNENAVSNILSVILHQVSNIFYRVGGEF